MYHLVLIIAMLSVLSCSTKNDNDESPAPSPEKFGLKTELEGKWISKCSESGSGSSRYVSLYWFKFYDKYFEKGGGGMLNTQQNAAELCSEYAEKIDYSGTFEIIGNAVKPSGAKKINYTYEQGGKTIFVYDIYEVKGNTFREGAFHQRGDKTSDETRPDSFFGTFEKKI